MIHNVLRTLGGIEHYGVVSLCFFGFIFASVLVWTFLQRKSHLDRMSQIPLEPDTTDLNSGKDRHE
jgi:hypothetical protein